MSQTQKTLTLNGRTITLVGTAHVSAESVKEVEAVIEDLKPDCVAIELDEGRAESLQNKDKYSQLDIIKVLKNHQGFLLMANLILSSFQRRMGMNTGVKPGDEMLAAMEKAKALNIKTAMVDRPIQVTLKRAWAKNSLWGKCKLLAALLTSAFSKDEVSSEEIENLKKGNEMDSMMNELSDYMPVIKQVLIDERNEYLAAKIWETGASNIVAVLGAGHLAGVEEYLTKLAQGTASTDMDEISEVPAKGFWGKIAGWIIPVIIIGLLVAGFIVGGKDAGITNIWLWIIWNGSLAAIGTIIAGGNIITIICAFCTAPLTSLCPLIGVGFVTGIIQAVISKPKVSDMETLQDDVCSLKGFYKNRILKVLLVFFLSSLGSSIGTFAGGADVLARLIESA